MPARPSSQPIRKPEALDLPPRDETLRLFTSVASEEERLALLSGLLQALWDAEKNDDLKPVRDWIVAWYYDMRFEDERGLSATLARIGTDTTVGYTHEELLRRLDLAAGE